MLKMFAPRLQLMCSYMYGACEYHLYYPWIEIISIEGQANLLVIRFKSRS